MSDPADLLAPLRALIEYWQQLSDQKETRCREIEGDDWDIVDGAEDAMRLGGCSRQLAALLPVLAARINHLQQERNYFEAHLQAALRAEAEIAKDRSKVMRRAEAAETALERLGVERVEKMFAIHHALGTAPSGDLFERIQELRAAESALSATDASNRLLRERIAELEATLTASHNVKHG